MKTENIVFQIQFLNYIDNVYTRNYISYPKEDKEIKMKAGEKGRKRGKWACANCEYRRYLPEKSDCCNR